ncbi:GNAT family N-acetyltransferase [Desulfopila sp. IMCC35008]|uniref:GNAT family N-acetyltransferase n=1 Tax=Desulfopila sp. IMCC35008 TaxID=2653858 RepID=UPI0013D2C935|nr:GNAT family N-acetyltransferase [Desulfopila sp. IMCC35008]
MNTIEIREAVADDSKLIHMFVKDLALYEKAEHEVVATVNDIRESVFGGDSTVKALICNQGNTPIGFAVYFYNYSTWQGRKGLYLEDLYISPAYRRGGAGRKLLKYLAGIAVAEGCGRFEWSVLDWNEPARQFYHSIGAKPKSEWISYQLAGEALLQFSKG